MAFHVACPITCRKICYCTLGLPGLKKEGKNAFLEEVDRIEEFLKDPWRRRSNDGLTVQVKVPKVVAVDLPPPPRPEFKNFQPQQKELVVAEVVQGKIEDGGSGGGGGGELDELALANVSAQSKRLALQKKAAATSEMVEDLVRKFEAGDLGGDMVDLAGEEQGQLNVKMMCRLCLSGEIDGTERARRMLPCKSCGKKYHRSCLKRWSQNRDLFHWSSWACPACRICEVCCRTGDPNKFMFCRRCDAAYHCYCQHPPHKNVSHGPYLCPKHTRCHSCGSNVPGNGSSLRWFLGYTCCDACGRLFVKGNYCPVCLKVYRDSESTPMVCCDICQRWVHCQCDDISNERYMEFQSDGNLQYACPTCRGECCQVRNPEEAVLELWRRRDEADRDLIASLREAAGLPTQDEIFSITPFSDDEDDGPAVSKNEHGRSIKLTLKSLLEKSPKKNEHGKKSWNKKSGKKKVQQSSVTGQSEAPQDIEGDRDEELPLFQTSEPENLTAVQKHKSVDEVVNNNGVRTSSRMVRVKSYTPHGEDFVSDSGTDMNITKSSKGPKLVIHLGSRNINSSNPPKADHTDQAKGSKSKIKIRKSNPDVTDRSGMFGSVSTPTGHALTAEVDGETQVRASRGSKRSFLEYAEGRPDVSGALDDVNGNNPAASNLVSKDSRPLLKLKLKKPHQENQISWIYAKDDEMSLPKGQRSKRKRPSSLREGAASALGVQDSGMDEIMDANWILQKLGKDAVGKRVEVHQPTDNSWHRGTVAEVFEGTSSVSVAMDDGKPKDLELGKQGVRFVSQKQRR